MSKHQGPNVFKICWSQHGAEINIPPVGGFDPTKKYWLVAGCQKRAISHVKKHQPNMFWPNLKPHHADIRPPRDTGYKYAQLTFHEWGCNEGGS